MIRPFKAITYFDNIDFGEDIVMLNSKYDWKLIEKRLVNITKIQDKVFESFPLPQKEQKSKPVKKDIHKRVLKR